MNIELPATVSQYAEAAEVSTTTVRRALNAGHLVRDPESKRTLIVSGELTWTIPKWEKSLLPHLSHIKPHLRGFDNEGNLKILRGDQVRVIPRGYCDADLREAIRRAQQA